MKAKPLVLTLVTLAVVGVAWQVSEERAPQTDFVRAPLFPDLLGQLNEVARVRLRAGEQETLLARRDDGWFITNKDDFPADGAKVRRTLLQLAALRTLEAKTSQAERYARLGVADPQATEGGATAIEVSDAAGGALARLLVGDAREAAGRSERYVREADAAQAWLVEGEIEVTADPIPWLDARIVDIDTDRVREVHIEPAAGAPITLRKAERNDNFFALQNVPAGFAPKSRATVSSIGALLLDLRFNDVLGAARVAGQDPVRTTTVRTFDGLVVSLRDYLQDDVTYTAFSFAFDAAGVVVTPATDDAAGDDEHAAEAAGPVPTTDATLDADAAEDADAEDDPPAEDVAAEAARLSALTRDWVYVLPNYKRRLVDRDLDSLLQPATEESAADE